MHRPLAEWPERENVPTAVDPLPLTETIAPADQAELVDVLRRAHASATPVYPIGGGTAQQFGLTPKLPGWGLSLANLNRVIDYPARDMTITVEAGMTMAALADLLATEGQRLPIDAPQALVATLGGVIATNTSGPRRFGFGTVRDYVIGIGAVDGRGTPFKGGGRVVKNVAGYDFCKLLTGSLGTLGVIAQVTLKLKPLAESSALVVCHPRDLADGDRLLAALVTSQTTPAAVEWLLGPAWHDPARATAGSPSSAPRNRALLDKPAVAPQGHAENDSGHGGRLVVALEGTRPEVEWMVAQLLAEWRSLEARNPHAISESDRAALWSQLTEFPAGEAPLVVQIAVRPGALAPVIADVLALDPQCSIQAHAASGIAIARFSEFTSGDAARVLVRGLQPAAVRGNGHATVLSCPAMHELTRQAVWGTPGTDADVMRAVKQQFDPAGILNPGRFVI